MNDATTRRCPECRAELPLKLFSSGRGRYNRTRCLRCSNNDWARQPQVRARRNARRRQR